MKRHEKIKKELDVETIINAIYDLIPTRTFEFCLKGRDKCYERDCKECIRKWLDEEVEEDEAEDDTEDE